MSNKRPVAFITGADQHLEQATKERLDAIACSVRFFREYDEPNEIFAPRLVREYPALAQAVALLHIWPACCLRRDPPQERGVV